MADDLEKLVQPIVEKIRERKGSYVKDNNGYTTDGSLRTVIPSTQGTAVAYDLQASSWNREGLNGGGVSYFQEVRVSDGEKDLVVIPRFQFRSGANYSQGDDFGSPGREEIVGLEDLGEGQYRVATVNHGRSNFLVDFKTGKVTRLDNLREEVPEYYHGETSYDCPRHYPSQRHYDSNRNNEVWLSENSSFEQEKGYSKNKPRKVATKLTFVRSSVHPTNNGDFDSELTLVGGKRESEERPYDVLEFTNPEADKYLVRVKSPAGERKFVVTTSFNPKPEYAGNYFPKGENNVEVKEIVAEK